MGVFRIILRKFAKNFKKIPMKNLLFLSFTFIFFILSYVSTSAQTSFKEAEKQKLKEEKSRQKAYKKTKKNNPKSEIEKPEKRPDYLEKKTNPRKRGTVPKASRNLSNENQTVTKNRQKNRKGNNGLTKAAKNQMREQKRSKN